MFERFLDNYRNPENELNDFLIKKAIGGLEKEEAVKDAITSPVEWEEKEAQIRSNFIKSIGGLDFEKGELNVNYTGKIDKGPYTIDKVVYQSLPGVYVTANLYIPKELDGKAPGILFSCGHSKPAKAEPKYQRGAIELALNGFVVLCVDPLGQGEMIQMPDRDDIDWGVYEHSYMGLSCTLAGMNIARYFIWNLIRSVDFLASLDFVDATKIGATGNSGGGTQTSYISMVDERIKAAAPGCFLNGRKQYIVKGHAHDSEQNIFNCMNFGLDYGDFISCFAPKPFRLLSQQYDFFPIEGVLYSLKRAKKVYALYGKADNADIVIDKDMHGLSDVLRHGLVEFFLKHFMGKDYRHTLNPYEYELPEEELWCTKAGNVIKEFDDAVALDRLIYDDYLKRRQRTGDLADRVRKAFRIQNRDRRFLEKRINPFDYEGHTAEKVFWIAEDEVSNAGIYIDGKNNGRITYVFFENGTMELSRRVKDIKKHLQHGDVFVMDPRGVGAVKGAQYNNAPYYAMYGTMHKMCNDALMNGSSMMEMHVNDILYSLRMSEKEISFAAYGKMCPAVLVAALLSKEVKEVRIFNGIESFDEIMRCTAPFVPEYEVFGMASGFDISEIISKLGAEGKLK